MKHKAKISGVLVAAAMGGALLGQTMERHRLPRASAGDVGRPMARRNNPYVTGVDYVLRLDQWSPYFIATGGALNLQTLFTKKVGDAYTPSGGAAQTLTNWSTTMGQGGLFSNPDMFNIWFMSLSVRADTYVQDLARFLSDTLITLNIGNNVPYAVTHAYRVPQGGGSFGASSAIVGNGFPQELNQYAMETADVNGIPVNQPNGTGEVFPGSGIPGVLGELVTQQQAVNVKMDPTQVVDANGNGVYTTSASGSGITAFVVLRGQYARAVQG